MRVLIVEDEFLLGALLAETLLDAGHEVSGPAAHELEALGFADATMPDLALVDIELRGGESGVEVARALLRRGVPSIFVTGQTRQARTNHALALGLVAKPYTPTSLIAVLAWVEAARSGLRKGRPPRGFEPFDSSIWQPLNPASTAILAAG
jgi:DNA-binding response OmpR family regulator